MEQVELQQATEITILKFDYFTKLKMEISEVNKVY